MFLVKKMVKEMDTLEFELLFPDKIEMLSGYYFEMDKVFKNGNWKGIIVMPDYRGVGITYFANSGKTKYEKNEAYYDFVDDAKKIYPLDSCAIDTMSALLVMIDSNVWEEIKE